MKTRTTLCRLSLLLAAALWAVPSTSPAQELQPLMRVTRVDFDAKYGAQPFTLLAYKLDPIFDRILRVLSNGIANEFKCANVLDDEKLSQMLAFIRLIAVPGPTEKELMDGKLPEEREGRNYWSDPASVLLSKLTNTPIGYIAASKAIVSGEDFEHATIFLSTIVYNYGKVQAVANASARFRPSSEDEMFAALNEMVKKLNEDLAYTEICPYTGTVKITSRTMGKASEEDQHYVTCNGGDSLYKKANSDDRSSVVEWKIEKKGRIKAKVDVEWRQRQEQLMTEEDGCHRCKSGRYGPHTTRETRKEQTDIVTRGTDGTAKLAFNRNGTFTLSLELVSRGENGKWTTNQNGIAKETIERIEEGTCDVAAPYRGELRRKVSINLVIPAIPGVGTPFDKRIAFRPPPVVQKSEFPDEETVIEAEIDLSRK